MCIRQKKIFELSLPAGFTLIEILISLLILSIGILGLAGLQASGMRNNHSAYLRSQANIFTYDIIDSMRANRGSMTNAATALGGAYNITIDATVPTGSATAQLDLARWLNAIATQLPSGKGSITQTPATPRFTIVIQWNDREIPPKTFSIDTRL